MVCIYCSHPTIVSNSRKSKRDKSVWRRRRCNTCVAQFTTKETPEYQTSLIVKNQDNTTQPFSRDKLFLSIYKSLSHHEDALNSSTAITETAIRHLLSEVKGGSLAKVDIINSAHLVLSRYDVLAANIYLAHHSTAR